MFRELTPEKLREDRDWSRYTSYAGPNFKDFPRVRAGAAAGMVRLSACDRCKDGKPYHHGPAGIVVLYSSSRVGLLDLSDLPNVPGPLIPVGPDSPNDLLKMMIFGPRGD